MRKKGVPCFRIGKVLSADTSTAAGFEIAFNGIPLIKTELRALRDLWQNAIGREMQR